jgi:hypothetical protein
MTDTDTRTAPTNAELTAGYWAWSQWTDNTACPRTLVGRIELDGDHDDEDDITLIVLDAPEGAHLWTHRPPARYVIRRTSPHLRPAWSEECATIEDRARRLVFELTDQLAEARRAMTEADAAYLTAWNRDAEAGA